MPIPTGYTKPLLLKISIEPSPKKPRTLCSRDLSNRRTMFPLGLRHRLLRHPRPRRSSDSRSATKASGGKRRRNAEEEATELRRRRPEPDAGVGDQRDKKPRLDQEEEKERKGGKKSLITDPRFASAHSDPRFQRMPRRESKVVIDSRFSRMFSDKNFATSSAPVDKRGKPRKGKEANPLLHYYLQQQQEEEDETELAKGERAEARTDVGGSEPELSAEEEEEQSTSLGSDEESTSDDDEENYEDYDDDESIGSDICRLLMANHEDTPLTDNETHRLAVVNMDWDHIKAVDIYVVMSSCLPKGGQILSVAIYPSEFGLKCMEVEAVRGPAGLFEANEEHSDDDSDDEKKKLRKYEFNKLRYYFAVVVCDSSATANHLYNTLDGSELLKTSNVFDLRFIPDSMEFKHPPRDITTEAPTGYKVPDFYTQALQHSNVKLTWEEDEPQRKKILRRKFNPKQLHQSELNAYLASTDDSDEEGDNDREASDAESDGAGDSPNGEAKKDIKREKLRALLLSGDDSDAGNSDDKDMEITFNTELEDLGKRMLEKKDKKSETVWEAVLRRNREKKKARRTRSKYSSEEDSTDSDAQGAADQPDDFFEEEEEPVEANDKVTKKKSSSATKGKGSRKVRDQSSDKDEEQEASRAELELLLADDQGADQGPKGYNLKTKKVKGKKGNEKPSEAKLPDVNISDDPRFAALFSSHLYALDPTDPQYKRSAAYVLQRSQKQQPDERVEATWREAENHPEQIPSTSDDRFPGQDVLHPAAVSLENEKNEFSSTVRSLKRNLGARVNESRGT